MVPAMFGGAPQGGSAVAVRRVDVRTIPQFAIDRGRRRIVLWPSNEMVERLWRCVHAVLALSRASPLPLLALALDPLFDNFARAPRLLCSY